jgi:hypothetical protein
MRAYIQRHGAIEFEFSQAAHYSSMGLTVGKNGMCSGYSTIFLYHTRLREMGAEHRSFPEYVSDKSSGGGLDMVVELCMRSKFGITQQLAVEIPKMLSDVGYKFLGTLQGGLVANLIKCIAAPGRYVVGWDGWCESGLGHVIAVDGLRGQPKVFDPNYGSFIFNNSGTAQEFILKLISIKYAAQSNLTCDKFLPS